MNQVMTGNEDFGCFRELLNEVSAQVVAFNKDYEIKWANQKAKDYLNYGNELKEKNCRQLFFENNFSTKESEFKECPFEEIFEDDKKITEELTNNQGETWEIQWFSSEKDDKGYRSGLSPPGSASRERPFGRGSNRQKHSRNYLWERPPPFPRELFSAGATKHTNSKRIGRGSGPD